MDGGKMVAYTSWRIFRRKFHNGWTNGKKMPDSIIFTMMFLNGMHWRCECIFNKPQEMKWGGHINDNILRDYSESFAYWYTEANSEVLMRTNCSVIAEFYGQQTVFMAKPGSGILSSLGLSTTNRKILELQMAQNQEMNGRFYPKYGSLQ